jgi:hypothetical protein
MSLSEAFKRRETALEKLAIFKANLYSILLAHRDWDWPPKPPTEDGGTSGRVLYGDRVLASFSDPFVIEVALGYTHVARG